MMAILPTNTPKETIETPQNFFIYGETMSGKSYLAGKFPNPLFLDTDGNAKSNPYPSIEIRNQRNQEGRITEEGSVLHQLDQVVLELQTTKHTYETIVLDVIDDIIIMIEQYVCDQLGVKSLADAGYGKGYAMVNSIVQQLVIDLKALPMNVIYISRVSVREEDNQRIVEPSLRTRYVNMVNGNCDFMIQTEKIGKSYLRVVQRKRKQYDRSKVQDQRIAKILDSVTGAFDRPTVSAHPQTKQKPKIQ
ncbi:MAG: AAA family ATPase [Aerococcus sp.]|nr:AAA family ATPase [Aerococcus sp.]